MGAGPRSPSPTPPPSSKGPNPGLGFTKSPNQTSAFPRIFLADWRPLPPLQAGEAQSGFPEEIRPRPGPRGLGFLDGA